MLPRKKPFLIFLCITFGTLAAYCLALVFFLNREVLDYASANYEVANSMSGKLAEDQFVLIGCTRCNLGTPIPDCDIGQWQIKVLHLNHGLESPSAGVENFSAHLNNKAFTIAVHEWIEGNESAGLAILKVLELCVPDFYYYHPSFKPVHIQRMRRGMETGFSSDKSLEKILPIINDECPSGKGYWRIPSAVLPPSSEPPFELENIGTARDWMFDHAEEYFEWLEEKQPPLRFLIEKIHVAKRRILTNAIEGVDRPYIIYEVKYGVGDGLASFGYILDINDDYMPTRILDQSHFIVLTPPVRTETVNGKPCTVFNGKKITYEGKALEIFIRSIAAGDRLLRQKEVVKEAPQYFRFPLDYSKKWNDLTPVRNEVDCTIPDSYQVNLERYSSWLWEKCNYLSKIPHELILHAEYDRIPLEDKMGTMCKYWIRAGKTQNIFILFFQVETNKNQEPIAICHPPWVLFVLPSSKKKTTDITTEGIVKWNHYRGITIDSEKVPFLFSRFSEADDDSADLIEKASSGRYIVTSRATEDVLTKINFKELTER